MSMREDGTVSIADMLNHAHQTERATDFISRIEEEEKSQTNDNESPLKRPQRLKSPTKRLMQHTPTPKKKGKTDEKS